MIAPNKQVEKDTESAYIWREPMLASLRDNRFVTAYSSGTSQCCASSHIDGQNCNVPICKDLQIVSLLGHNQICNARLQLLAGGILNREVRCNLGENENRVLDMHVFVGFKASFERL